MLLNSHPSGRRMPLETGRRRPKSQKHGRVGGEVHFVRDVMDFAVAYRSKSDAATSVRLSDGSLVVRPSPPDDLNVRFAARKAIVTVG